MEDPSAIMILTDISTIIYILKMFLIGMYTYYTFNHILNIKLKFSIKSIIIVLFTFIIAILHTRLKSDYFISMIFFVLSLSILYSFTTSNKVGYSMLITIFSLSFNYVIYFISIIISFIPNVILGVQDIIINFILINTIHFILLFFLFKIRKFKDGISFFKKNLDNESFDLLILNVSAIILFSSILLKNYQMNFTLNLCTGFIILGIIMFITIYKSLNLYYKHNLLVKDLNDTKSELDNKNKEITKLETEILKFSKTSHSIAHKQQALEFKIKELMLNTELANELDIKEKLTGISKEYFNNSTIPPLPKTEITEIDDMLKFQQHECIENNIQFELQLNGNIHHMINKFVSKEDLEILIADHIKNSIIAIKNSDNINRSILIRLGLIDDYYSIYVYDSGIEFETNTLENLGKKPITTHSDSGGTGLGFMNTFDTLKKYNASIIINELNPPYSDNYTKSIIIKFDDKHDFIINSYHS